jgi:hypothetical protein
MASAGRGVGVGFGVAAGGAVGAAVGTVVAAGVAVGAAVRVSVGARVGVSVGVAVGVDGTAVKSGVAVGATLGVAADVLQPASSRASDPTAANRRDNETIRGIPAFGLRMFGPPSQSEVAVRLGRLGTDAVSCWQLPTATGWIAPKDLAGETTVPG